MGLMLKTQRDGTLRAGWYGVYTENGRRTVANLNVKWDGHPPASGRVGDTGDADFEHSREIAEAALKRHVEDAAQKGRADHLTERLIRSKTGRSVEYVSIADLPERWRNMGRGVPAGEAHLVNCDAHFHRFIKFMKTKNASAVRLYEVTPEDAAAYVTEMGKKLAPATAQYGVRLIAKSMSRLLPVGAANPFSEFIGRRKSGESGVIHRKPFTQDELKKLLAAARDDAFMYPLIVTAACSGMRRADVCCLRWRDVDLAGGMLAVKTSKTEAAVEIPIFAPLRAVFEGRGGKGKGYVFPEAAAMMRDQADGLTYRFKVLVAKALDKETGKALPEPTPAAEIQEEGLAAIDKHLSEGTRRDRTLDTFRRYCAGESVRAIHKATGRPKPTISYDLHSVEEWTGKHFIRSGQAPGIKHAIARVTREDRKGRQKAASVRDWHALRTTFVTLALSAGVPMELVRRVTGHAKVEVVLKHYFRPDREHFRAALTDALPEVLTGDKATQQSNPADEMGVLLEKVKAGTASKTDRKRFRLLAAKV